MLGGLPPRLTSPPGTSRRLDTDPPIALWRTDDGAVYAIDDTCTHQDASLADGWLEGCAVECPLHASRFDLRTGAVDAPPAKAGVAHPRGGDRRRRDPRRAHMRSIADRCGASVGRGVGWPARALRQLGFDGRLSIVGDEPHLPYDRPPLSKEFLAGTMAEPISRCSSTTRTSAPTGGSASPPPGSMPATRTLHLSDGTELRPDGIVIATGARPRELPASEAAGGRAAGRAPAAHARRRPGPAGRAGRRARAGRRRRGLHRSRGRLDRAGARARGHGRRGAPHPAGRSAGSRDGPRRVVAARGERRAADLRNRRRPPRPASTG